jgi:hypothetical protein
MLELLKDVFTFLYEQEYGWFVTILMTMFMIIIGLLLKIIKKPIKHFTSKIKNEKLRKLANKSIIVLSFAIAIGFWYLLHYLLPQYFTINWGQIILSGALPIVAYAVFDGILPVEKVKKIVNKVIDATVDGVITADELKEIGETISKAVDSNDDSAVTEEKSDKTEAESAEDLLDKLLDE